MVARWAARMAATMVDLRVVHSVEYLAARWAETTAVRMVSSSAEHSAG